MRKWCLSGEISMTEHLDRELLDELAALMEDQFPNLIETFLADAQRQHQQISDAWRAQDLDGLRRSAHSLKGSSSNLGAAPLADLCSQLEAQARRAQADGIGERIDAVAVELEAVCGALRAHLSAA